MEAIGSMISLGNDENISVTRPRCLWNSEKMCDLHRDEPRQPSKEFAVHSMDGKNSRDTINR